MGSVVDTEVRANTLRPSKGMPRMPCVSGGWCVGSFLILHTCKDRLDIWSRRRRRGREGHVREVHRNCDGACLGCTQNKELLINNRLDKHADFSALHTTHKHTHNIK